ncbi:hypothetical protein R3P38DRAFT_2809805 [Favolaschia claudopus]|uniref:Uncharacterized protein n=1 Tax=Favolaschia claudopus TaxID=2862362 RepID=A0AAV9ZCD6_9AGAR
MPSACATPASANRPQRLRATRRRPRCATTGWDVRAADKQRNEEKGGTKRISQSSRRCAISALIQYNHRPRLSSRRQTKKRRNEKRGEQNEHNHSLRRTPRLPPLHNTHMPARPTPPAGVVPRCIPRGGRERGVVVCGEERRAGLAARSSPPHCTRGTASITANALQQHTYIVLPPSNPIPLSLSSAPKKKKNQRETHSPNPPPAPAGPKSHFIFNFLQCVHAPGLFAFLCGRRGFGFGFAWWWYSGVFVFRQTRRRRDCTRRVGWVGVVQADEEVHRGKHTPRKPARRGKPNARREREPSNKSQQPAGRRQKIRRSWSIIEAVERHSRVLSRLDWDWVPGRPGEAR